MEITVSNLEKDYNYINKNTFIIKDAKQTSSRNINEEYFQNLFNIYQKRANKLETLPFSDSHQISNNLVINMKNLVKDLKKDKNNNIGFNESYSLSKDCLSAIINKGAENVTLHIIMIEDPNPFTTNEIDNIHTNDLQFAISFDNENRYYLAFNTPKLKEISNEEFIKSKEFFNKNFRPKMDENLAFLTNNVKNENTSKIYIPTSSFKNFENSESITLHPGLSDVNASHLLHSISYLYNFTVILSGSILDTESSTGITYNEDVYRTCRPYCGGTGGGIM